MVMTPRGVDAEMDMPGDITNSMRDRSAAVSSEGFREHETTIAIHASATMHREFMFGRLTICGSAAAGRVQSVQVE
jgi:hypothetical protein